MRKHKQLYAQNIKRIRNGVVYPNKKFRDRRNSKLKYELLSKEYLYNLYIKRDLKVSEIAKLLNMSYGIVLKYLHMYDIQIKGVSYYLQYPVIEFTKEQYEFFDGLMLSVGSLSATTKYSNGRLSCMLKYKQVAEYINDYLGLGGKIKSKVYKHLRCSGSKAQYVLISKNNKKFTKERKRWFFKNKKKIPNNFRFSSISMNVLYMFCGYYMNDNIVIPLSSFSVENIDRHIIKKLNNIGIDCIINGERELCMCGMNVGKFLEYIGPCSIFCYKYKWE